MKKSSSKQLAEQLGIKPERAVEAKIKAQLITALIKAVNKKKLTHQVLSERSGIPRSAITGILSGGLQKITINRILRLLDAAGLEAEIKVKNVA